MAGQYDGHLTTEELSAFLDKQFTPREQLDWNAHLRACQECQRRLADLRQTVALLHALPQAELPRSFVLPTRTDLASERHPLPGSQRGLPIRQSTAVTPIALARPRNRSVLQRSVRVLSTIAAVVGFLLILSGFLTGTHIGGSGTFASNTVSTGASTTANHSSGAPPKVTQPEQAANATTTGPQGSDASNSTPQVIQTPNETVKSAPGAGPVQNQHSSLPTILDLNTSEVLEGVGLALLVLGLLGIIVMSIVRRRAERA